MVSRCCKSNVYVMVDYYVCEKCHRTCNLMLTKECYDDTRIKEQAKELTGAA